MCKHSNFCNEQHGKALAWQAEHPNHCTKCNGAGSNGKPSDPSVGLYDPEPCEHCIGQGICPECGHQHDDEWDGETCDACGWTWENPSAVVWECTCWEDEIVADLPDADLDADMANVDLDALLADSDFAYDAWRETSRARMFRGRD